MSVVSSAHGGPLAETSPPGSHFKLSADVHADMPTFKSGQPVIGTSYFYWYDIYSGVHIFDPDGTDAMTTHPPRDDMADLSYLSVGWHHQQIHDVAAAGIDFLMPVFWGVPGEYDGWSFVGLKKLMEAYEQARHEEEEHPGYNPLPQVGMFYDTSTLRFNNRGSAIDLTTDEGREWFYVTIRDFWSLIPPRLWARVDGRPIIFLYAAEFATAVDDRLFDDFRGRFREDFGTDVFLVRHLDWPGRADAWYIWGGALGLKIGEHVAALGPGYDDSAVQGRTPLVVDRLRGAFYDRQWERLLRMDPACRPWMVHVETWNEWHEGTDIARSQEASNLYMRATNKFGGAFHMGARLDPYGPFVNARELRWSASEVDGLHLRPSEADGCWQRVETDAGSAIVSAAGKEDRARYVYFDTDDSCVFGECDRAAEVTVVFHDDGGCERFHIEYDSSNLDSGARGGAFRPGRAVVVGQTGAWRTITQQLPEVWFCNRCNDADLRLVVQGGRRELTVREVLVRKLPGRHPATSQPAVASAPASEPTP